MGQNRPLRKRKHGDSYRDIAGRIALPTPLGRCADLMGDVLGRLRFESCGPDAGPDFAGPNGDGYWAIGRQ